ncbi:hypothetical protein D6T63_00840 [Arthrobacter cheniae]|uniref:Uncharacterized protein n=1 Tax=Arthrobacter cheniae TaxID=1258888 RepID=A0A3A5M5P1_9MICC|nr:hypothetical protein [Arthrobacter cheniae]RJT83040.1 hypothetical protein D6T63_00840 [Arthrobacter cheniae]
MVEIASDGPQWWEVVGALAPFAALLAAVLATVTAFATLRQRTTADRASLEQKRRADDRAEWGAARSGLSTQRPTPGLLTPRG